MSACPSFHSSRKLTTMMHVNIIMQLFNRAQLIYKKTSLLLLCIYERIIG